MPSFLYGARIMRDIIPSARRDRGEPRQKPALKGGRTVVAFSNRMTALQPLPKMLWAVDRSESFQ
jgi:hypothetical protein